MKISSFFKLTNKRNARLRQWERAIWRAGFEHGRAYEKAVREERSFITGSALIDQQIKECGGTILTEVCMYCGAICGEKDGRGVSGRTSTICGKCYVGHKMGGDN